MTTATPYLGDEIDKNSAGSLTPATTLDRPSEIECLCPFCGSFNACVGKPCGHCHLEDNTTNRSTTKQQLGPWYVLQASNPSAPGMNFETLKTLVQRQVITSRSVVRGPTTGQLWRLASKIRGLSREFGQCYSCGGDIESNEINCPHCDRVQTIPEQTDAPAPVVVPAADKLVREALLAEPEVHVQVTDPTTADRPVLAERFERHIPKDDLLTPRDVAKAFQLEFGLKPEQIAAHLYRPRYTDRNLKIAFSSAGALIALVMIFPLIHVVSGWINSNQAEASVRSTAVPAAVPIHTPILEPVAVAAAPELAAAAARAPEPVAVAPVIVAPIVPTPVPISAQVAEVPPAVSSAIAAAAITPVPAPQPEPIPVASSEDDPTTLWNSGLNAESNGNYADAIKAYERIESLPSYSWPAHLETRLELVRKELKGDAR